MRRFHSYCRFDCTTPPEGGPTGARPGEAGEAGDLGFFGQRVVGGRFQRIQGWRKEGTFRRFGRTPPAAHLLYSPALQRGEVKMIEDFPPIPGVKLAVRVPERVTKVRAIPAGETLAFTQEAGVLTVAVPTFTMHTGIVLEYSPTP